MNGEPKLTPLFEAGLITPNEYHYVRNHGPVPHLLWEFHKLEIRGLEASQQLQLSMDELVERFDSINIPVALACDGNRRKELNMIKGSKGFNWGSGAVSCAYWKGARLRDVLLAAGIPEMVNPGRRLWVNFEGADEPSEGKYATCIPFDYAMDPTNDVILAYEMNDVPLPPDHGHPIRVIIPGYVGGRCVKWLHRVWVSEKENESHYHIWDNRVLPAFITEKDGEFADVGFMHPSTACNEQKLSSLHRVRQSPWIRQRRVKPTESKVMHTMEGATKFNEWMYPLMMVIPGFIAFANFQKHQFDMETNSGPGCTGILMWKSHTWFAVNQ